MIKLLKLVAGALFGGVKTRYESRHELLTGVAFRLSFRVYNKNLSWHLEPNFRNIWGEFSGSGRQVHDRKFVLHSIAQSVQDVPGEIVECGVFKGGGSFVMLAATNSKHLFGFDSFEGLSEPTEDDTPASSTAFHWRPHDMAVGSETARKNLAKFEGRFTFFPGWIPSRFQEVKDKKISLLHIDVDLFEPTFASLEFFYPRMSPGGIIVCDDYGFSTCPGARKAMDLFFRTKTENVIHLTTGQGIVFVSGIQHDLNDKLSQAMQDLTT